MSYSIKEIFYTLQGEGAQSGRASIFCRFSGCNLWSGREVDRDSAKCQFCDTDFLITSNSDEAKFTNAEDLAAKIDSYWPSGGVSGKKFVVCTGGEPLLQLDEELIDALHKHGYEIAVETNGTILAPQGIDWICVSPKAGTQIIQRNGNELKLVFPQNGIDPQIFETLEFSHFFLQPMDGLNTEENLKATIQYCMENPKWRLSIQMHKAIGIS